MPGSSTPPSAPKAVRLASPTRLLAGALLGAVLASASGCGSKPEGTSASPSPASKAALPAGVAAVVNGENISQTDLDSELNKIKGREVLQNLIDDRLILQAAKKAELKTSPAEVKERMEEIKDNPQYQTLARNNGLTDADLQAKVERSILLQKLILQEVSQSEELHVFDQYKDSLEKVHLYHILVDIDKPDVAKKVAAELKAGKSFDSLAREYSKDPISKEKGGDLGWMPKAPLATELGKAAFAMKIDEISSPIKTKFGWHIIKVTGHKRSFDELKRDIEDALAASKQAQFVGRLRAKGDVKTRFDSKSSLDAASSEGASKAASPAPGDGGAAPSAPASPAENK